MFFWRLLSAVLVIYIILISMRVLLSWFPGAAYGRYWKLLLQVTDPYLKLFRGLGFLQRGMFDFTVVAAILVLVMALNLTSAILHGGRFTAGLVLGSLVGALWSGLSFLILFFLILAGLRLLLLLFVRRYENPIGGLLAAMVQPVVSLARGLLPGRWSERETHVLLVVLAALTVALLVGGWLFGVLRGLLYALPV